MRALAEQAERHLAPDDAATALLIAAQAVALDLTDSHAQAQRGQALMRLGRPLEAVSAFKVALAANPEIPALHLLPGNVYRAAGDNHLAAFAYGEAVQRASDMGGAWRNFGLALLGSGDVEGAVKALRRACALEPDAAAGWNSLGAALHAMGAPSPRRRAWHPTHAGKVRAPVGTSHCSIC